MAYDEELAFRVRAMLDGEERLTERGMFGGLAFMLGGNMAIVVSGQGGLLARVGREEAERLESEPGATRFEMRGREMRGWLRVEAAAVGEDGELRRWVDRCTAFARSLPPK